MTKSPPRVVAFDGDDTLWHNETVFVITQDEFRALVLRHADLPYEEIDARLSCRRCRLEYGPEVLFG